MKISRRMISLLLAFLMIVTVFPIMKPARAEYGDGESCFVCDGYMNYENCCQGCGQVHSEDYSEECYHAMHCKTCGECFFFISGCAQCGQCEVCCGYRCSECGDYFCDDTDMFCETCDMCKVCAENESLHCSICEECDPGGVCEDCGLCVFCQYELLTEGGGHCPVCDTCLYAEYGSYSEDNLCPVHGDEHCYACYEEFQCEQCGDCYAGEEDSFCVFCGLCPDCCQDNSYSGGCSSGEVCVEDPDFEDHFCPQCENCFCEVDYCETCGEWCQDCCDEERCDECGLCPNTYDGDYCDTCGAGGSTLDEHIQIHYCEETRCSHCGFCHNALEDAYGYTECPCCGRCPNECVCSVDCEDCICNQVTAYASPYNTKDKMILTVTVTNEIDNSPMEGAVVYYSHDKRTWHRLGESDGDGIVEGNVARSLKGDLAIYNLSGWYVSVVNRKSSAGGYVKVGDVYCIPNSDKKVSFTKKSDYLYQASTVLKLIPTDYDPSVYYSGQYDVLLTMPKREVDAIPFSLHDYFSNKWSKGSWGISSYLTNQLTDWAWKDNVLGYFKANEDYFGAYLIPYVGKSNVPAENSPYYFTPLYHFEGNTMVGDYVSEGLTEDIVSGGDHWTVGLQMLRFHDVPAGTYQLFVVMPECKLFTRKVNLTFQDGGVFESAAYDHFTLRQIIRKRDLDKDFFRLGLMDQYVRRADGTAETKDFVACLDGNRMPRAGFILTYDRATGRKYWAVNDSFARADTRTQYTFWVPRCEELDYLPYLLSYDVRPYNYEKTRNLQSPLQDYYYPGRTIKPLEDSSYTGLHQIAIQRQSAKNNPDSSKYYRLRLYFGEADIDSEGHVNGLAQPLPNNTNVRFTLEYCGNNLVFDNYGATTLPGLRGYYSGQDFTLPEDCQLGGMVNQFSYNDETRSAHSGWVYPVNSGKSKTGLTNIDCYIDAGLVKGKHITLRGLAYLDGYGPLKTVRGPVAADVTWNDSSKTVDVTFVFTKLNRQGMINGYGTHRVSANATPATKNKLDPADPYIYVNGNKNGSIYNAACGDEIEVKFTTAAKESVNQVTFARSGSSLELKSVTVNPTTKKRTFVYTFTMGREDTDVLVELGWPDGKNGYDPSFLYPPVNYGYYRYVGEPLSISAAVGGDAGSMTYGVNGWTYSGQGKLYRKTSGSDYYVVEEYQNTHSMSWNVDTSRAGTSYYYFTYKGANSSEEIQSRTFTVNVMTPFQVDYSRCELDQTIYEGDYVNLSAYFVDNVKPDGVTYTWSVPLGQDVNGDGDSTDSQKLNTSTVNENNMNFYHVETTKDVTPPGTYLIRCWIQDQWGHSETLAFHLTVLRDNRLSRDKYCAAQPELRCAVTSGGVTVTAVSQSSSAPSKEITVPAYKPVLLDVGYMLLPEGDPCYQRDSGELLPLSGSQNLIVYVTPRVGFNPTDIYRGKLNGWEGSWIPDKPGQYTLTFSTNNTISNLQPDQYGSSVQSTNTSQKIHITVEEPVNPFTDVKESNYFYNAVMWAVAQEPPITNGVDATHFKPKQACTRAEVVTFLWNAAGRPEPVTVLTNPFTDVKPKDWYYKAVLWAVENHITSGADATHFKPKDTCTRAEVVTFLWNAAGRPEPSLKGNPFTDVKSSKWYYKPVIWALVTGITKGVDATHFGPNQTCTRGQVVTFLMKADDLLTVKSGKIQNVLGDGFLMYLENRMNIAGRGTAMIGRVVNGSARVGDLLMLHSYGLGNGKPQYFLVRVEAIEKLHSQVDQAQAGDYVGILVSGAPEPRVNVGDALTSPNTLISQTQRSVVIGRVQMSSDAPDDLWSFHDYEFCTERGGDVTAAVLFIPDGQVSPGESCDTVGVSLFYHSAVWYVGQELTIRRDGQVYGTFTVTDIRKK